MAKDPVVVSAPIDGVIADVLVHPNQTVQAGTALFRYEDTTLRNQFLVAEKQLTVARAEHSQSIQAGFGDPQRKAEVPLKEAEVDLRQTELQYAKEMLDQVEVIAPQAGLLLYSDKSDWIGRPVTVGERIMEIADPKQIELRIDLPVADAIVLKEGAEALIFLNALALESFPATVVHASYHAEVSTRRRAGVPGHGTAHHTGSPRSHRMAGYSQGLWGARAAGLSAPPPPDHGASSNG